MNEATACPRCGTAVGEGRNYCIGCGHDLRGPAPAPAETGAQRASAAVDQRLRACPWCRAPNAASRHRCARCRGPLDESAPWLADDEDGADAPAAVQADRETSATLVIVVIVTGLVVFGVVTMLLSARGIGWFAGPPEAPAPGTPVAVEVVAARASSSLPPSGDVTYDAQNVFDGDPTTAWNAAGSGEDAAEWVELILDTDEPISRLLVWNGYQKGQQFTDNARVVEIDIEIGERTLTAELLDVRGPQAIDLPEPVTGDRVRLTIRRIYEGDRYTDAALSEVEVHATRDPEPTPDPTVFPPSDASGSRG